MTHPAPPARTAHIFSVPGSDLGRALKRIPMNEEAIQISVSSDQVTLQSDVDGVVGETAVTTSEPTTVEAGQRFEFATRSDTIITIARHVGLSKTDIRFQTTGEADDQPFLEYKIGNTSIRQLIDDFSRYEALPSPPVNKVTSPAVLAKSLKEVLPLTTAASRGDPVGISVADGSLSMTTPRLFRSIGHDAFNDLNVQLAPKAAKTLTPSLHQWHGDVQIADDGDRYLIRGTEAVVAVPRGKIPSVKPAKVLERTADSFRFFVATDDFIRGVACVAAQSNDREAVIEFHHEPKARVLALEIRCTDGMASFNCSVEPISYETSAVTATEDYPVGSLGAFRATDLRKVEWGNVAVMSLQFTVIGLLLTTEAKEKKSMTLVSPVRRVLTSDATRPR